MLAKFKLTKNQLSNIVSSLNILIWLYDLDWESAFEMLSKIGFSDPENKLGEEWKDATHAFQTVLYGEDCYNPNELNIDVAYRTRIKNLEMGFEQCLYEKAGESSDKQHKYELEVKSDDLEILELAADTTIRLALGQWDILGKILMKIQDKSGQAIYKHYFCFEPFVPVYRNRILPVFNQLGVAIGCNFGIHSKEISENIREIYDFYKVLLFEWKPIEIYNYLPSKTARDELPMPAIEFPLLYICTFDGDIEKAKEELDKLTPPYNVRPYFCNLDASDTIHVNVEGVNYNVYRRLVEGDRVYRKLNGYYVVVNVKGGKESE